MSPHELVHEQGVADLYSYRVWHDESFALYNSPYQGRLMESAYDFNDYMLHLPDIVWVHVTIDGARARIPIDVHVQ